MDHISSNRLVAKRQNICVLNGVWGINVVNIVLCTLEQAGLFGVGFDKTWNWPGPRWLSDGWRRRRSIKFRSSFLRVKARVDTEV